MVLFWYHLQVVLSFISLLIWEVSHFTYQLTRGKIVKHSRDAIVVSFELFVLGIHLFGKIRLVI